METPTFTDQQISRRSKVPLKTLREHPEFMERFREFMNADAKGNAALKRGRELLKEARITKDRDTAKEAGKLSREAADAFATSSALYAALVFPGSSKPVLPQDPAE